MNFEWLMSFHRFAATLNFTKAAALRHISQPALFKHIQQLTEFAGTALYTKSGRTLALTPTGTIFANFAQEMIERTQSLQTELGQRNTDHLVLAAGQGAFLYVLGPALKKFCAKDKKRLSLVTASQTEALQQIRNGRAHLAVTVLQTVPKDLVVTRLKRITSLLVVHPKHPLANQKKIRLNDLDGIELILPPEPSPMRSDISAVLRSKGIEPNVVIEATGWELMMHFSSLGLGAAIINALCPIPRSLRAIPIDGLPPVDYFLVFRREQYFFPALKLLKETILKETV